MNSFETFTIPLRGILPPIVSETLLMTVLQEDGYTQLGPGPLQRFPQMAACQECEEEETVYSEKSRKGKEER